MARPVRVHLPFGGTIYDLPRTVRLNSLSQQINGEIMRKRSLPSPYASVIALTYQNLREMDRHGVETVESFDIWEFHTGAWKFFIAYIDISSALEDAMDRARNTPSRTVTILHVIGNDLQDMVWCHLGSDLGGC